ncbi:MAG: hypothetical protein ABSG49_03765 [Methanoregula sp.]|jgi:hypothetical protein|uniref:hypothetical protein n=1 Tax=Methanoregula sp. TaxID=2052170 RepID=UPI003C21BADA
MSREPRSYRALKDGCEITPLWGTVQVAEYGPESRYDFTITETLPVAFVRMRFAGRILATLEEIAANFHDDILRLRPIANVAAISRELWLRSKHGTWRFFRIENAGLIELGRDGRPLGV